jgi:hypothetical protein
VSTEMANQAHALAGGCCRVSISICGIAVHRNLFSSSLNSPPAFSTADSLISGPKCSGPFLWLICASSSLRSVRRTNGQRVHGGD